MAKILKDKDTQDQMRILENVRGNQYFRGFEPRGYDTYQDRLYNPIAYLEDVGIEKIGELVQHGYSLMDISKLLSISSRVMRRWIGSSHDYLDEIESARVFSADEYAHRGLRVLEAAPAAPEEINRAGKIAEHLRWLASKYDKEMFGTNTLNLKSSHEEQVTYNFNVDRQPIAPFIEASAKIINKLPKPKLNLADLLTEEDGNDCGGTRG